MGSSPTYNPRDLIGPFATQAAYEAKFGNAAGTPLFNRADQSAYPTGSIFKPITSLAALSAGLITPSDKFNDTGCFQTGARKDIDKSCNAGGKAYGPVNMVDALRVSSDTYFYNLGKKLFLQGGLSRCRSGRTTSASGAAAGSTCPGRRAARCRARRRSASCRRWSASAASASARPTAASPTSAPAGTRAT